MENRTPHCLHSYKRPLCHDHSTTIRLDDLSTTLFATIHRLINIAHSGILCDHVPDWNIDGFNVFSLTSWIVQWPTAQTMCIRFKKPFLRLADRQNNKLPLKTCRAWTSHPQALLLPYRFTYIQYHHNYFWANRKEVFISGLKPHYPACARHNTNRTSSINIKSNNLSRLIVPPMYRSSELLQFLQRALVSVCHS